MYNYLNLWDQIDPIRFYKKDKHKNSFKSFAFDLNGHAAFNGLHPNEKSHQLWAKELYNYIKEHKVINLEKYI
jgi:lysophospholipase L1-like esterase